MLTEEYAPMSAIITKLSSASSMEEVQGLVAELQSLSVAFEQKLSAFDEEFNRIKAEDEELHTKIEQLNALLDEKMRSVSKLDFANSIAVCKTKIKFWDCLDTYSQKYLAMANYLLDVLSMHSNADYSPAVLEYGRTLENELVVKIYDDFIANRLSCEDDLPEDNLYKDLRAAAINFTKYGNFQIPAQAMINYLSYMSDDIDSDYRDAMIDYCDGRKIEYGKLSSNKFVSRAAQIIKKRNDAAHWGHTLPSHVARACQDDSHDALKIFINATSRRSL